MATGGTIPSNRTQTVTFYNTTGVIDREKNMYYVPRFSKTHPAQNSPVQSAYRTAFATVCPPSSAYSAIVLSNWLPSDRTLVVKGDVDDFRLVSDEGACLNYFIVTRTVTKGNTTKTYYYAYFITGVRQSGGSSVEVTAEPDDFTNVFYLHNTHALTSAEISGDYEPFNDMMKNCYVKRQHYNRVKNSTEIWIPHEDYGHVSTSSTDIATTVTIANIGTGLTIRNLSLVEEATSGSGTHGDPIYISETGLIIMFMHSSVAGQYYDIKYHLTYEEQVVLSRTTDNEKIFLNQEENYHFKYQYRDSKYPLSLMNYGFKNFRQAEINQIEANSNFSNLSSSLQEKIKKACVNFLAIEFKSYEVIGASLFKNDTSYGGFYCKCGGNVTKEIKRPNPLVIYPFVYIPKVFEKYNLNLSIYSNVSLYVGGTLLSYTQINLSDEFNKVVDDILNTKNYGDYIYNAYIIPYLPIEKSVSISGDKIIIDSFIDVGSTTSAITGRISKSEKYNKGINLVGLLDSANIGYDYNHTIQQVINELAYGVYYTYPDGTFSGRYFGLILSEQQEDELRLRVEETLPDLTTNYYDPVLQTEPYSFYSISYLSSIELALNRNRYYTGGWISMINFNFYISINGAIKIGIIPKYTVENVTTQYFNEGVSSIVLSNLPIVSDSYTSYYYANLSRMKSQFAINDYNRGVDLLQHFFISGPNAVGNRASRGTGGWGALAETGNQAMQMIDEAIDWTQSTKAIEMSQKAMLADMGRKPDSLKNSGSDVYYDCQTKENCLFLNHYTIDSLSYNSIAKMLERVGYQVNLYDTLHVVDRVGWNYIQLNAFDFNPTTNIMVEQENTIRQIFSQGVTLLHDKSFLTAGHNYEKILEN